MTPGTTACSRCGAAFCYCDQEQARLRPTPIGPSREVVRPSSKLGPPLKATLFELLRARR